MPKVVDHEEARARIREAARAVFAEQGLARTGLVHVARRAGMGRASLYHYYPTKDALLAGLADDLLREELLAFAAAAGSSGDPFDAIVDVATGVTRLYGDWVGEGRIVMQFWAEHPERFRSALREIRSDLAGLVLRGQKGGSIDPVLDPMGAATVVAGIIDGVLFQYFLDPDAWNEGVDAHDAVRHAVEKVLRP